MFGNLEIGQVDEAHSNPPWTTGTAAQHGVSDRVRAVGYVSDADLPSLYRRAGCFATAASAEGFGLPVIEAMTAGLPVVVPNSGALPELVATAGCIFDVGNARQLGEQIFALLTDGATRARRSAAVSRRAENFSWSTTAELTANVLSEAAAVSRVQRFRSACSLLPNATRWVA